MSIRIEHIIAGIVAGVWLSGIIFGCILAKVLL